MEPKNISPNYVFCGKKNLWNMIISINMIDLDLIWIYNNLFLHKYQPFKIPKVELLFMKSNILQNLKLSIQNIV